MGGEGFELDVRKREKGMLVSSSKRQRSTIRADLTDSFLTSSPEKGVAMPVTTRFFQLGAAR